MSTLWAKILIGVLLGVFAGMGVWSAVRLSPTVDETGHAVAAWRIRFEGSYLFDSNNPPGWQHLAGLVMGRGDYDPATGFVPDGKNDVQAVYLAARLPPGSSLVVKGRLVMLGVAVGLGMLVVIVAWRVGGAVAGVGAAAAFAMEPLMLGHSPLMKNDVVFALAFFGAAVAVWEAGRKWAWWKVGVVGLSAGACVVTKMTGLVAVGVMLPVCAGVAVWGVGSGWKERVWKWAVLVGMMWVMAYGSVWGAYGFRYSPVRHPTGAYTERFDLERIVRDGEKQQLARQISEGGGTEWRRPTAVRMGLWLDEHRLLPNAMVAGLMEIALTTGRRSYLLGEYGSGWWWYFPFAWLVKTPVVLVVLTVGGLGAAVWKVKRLRRYAWLVVPAAMMGGLAMAAKFNIGLRHVSAVYPFVAVGVGLTAARIWRQGVWGRRIAGLALVMLAAEVWPQAGRHIQFFNVAAGGSRGGLALLSDSNLDWGQDLWRLADWQKTHEGEELYLCYFGYTNPAPPHEYGLRFKNAPGSWIPGQRWALPGGKGVVLAISATHLQGTYMLESYRGFLAELRAREPMEVLGGTIYLYRME